MNNMGSINYAKEQSVKSMALLKVNVRRLYLILEDTKTRPPWFKNTKRSRQRWRAKGGAWIYDPTVLAAYREASAQLFGQSLAVEVYEIASRTGFMRRLMEKGNQCLSLTSPMYSLVSKS
jgi:hypothetical protein